MSLQPAPLHPAARLGQPAFHRALGALALREMATTYGRSPGGWLWAILEPVAAIALLSFAFSLAFRAPPLGTSFPLFYATGFLVYMLFHDVSQKTATSIRFSRPLLGFGAVTWIDAVLARFLLNTFTHCLIAMVVLGSLSGIAATALPDIPMLALAFTMAACLAIGIGVFNCYMFHAFPAWERLWTIAMRPMFIVSGVVFLFEDVPNQYQPILALNPLFHVTGHARDAFYPTYAPDYVSAAYVFAVSAAFAVLGLLLLDRFHDDLIHK